ncbi:MAG: hypothetical protein AVDCRST_MAG64-2677, partial [uncultured Phycisphaerae bacterium]
GLPAPHPRRGGTGQPPTPPARARLRDAAAPGDVAPARLAVARTLGRGGRLALAARCRCRRGADRRRPVVPRADVGDVGRIDWLGDPLVQHRATAWRRVVV